MAGRHHPRRHHPEAHQLRGNRRHRRGADHLAAGSAAFRTQLGLPLLLAARRLFRGQGAQPHRRHPDHGGFHRLHPVHRGRTEQMRPVYGIVPIDPIDEWIAPDLKGYRDDGPVRIGNAAVEQVQHDAYGSVILAAMPMFFDRRLPRPGDEGLFRLLEKLAPGRASWRWSRMPASGNIAAASASTPIRPRCAGPAVTGSRHRSAARACRTAPLIGRPWRTPCSRRWCSALGTKSARPSPPHWIRRHGCQRPAAARTGRDRGRTIRALSAPSRRSSRNWCAAACHALCGGGRFRPAGDRISWSAASG